ncbi:hypothetical protein [Granulicella sp. L60]|uniref:hypothetical protein n=1 Tax=Granulicella sp. L60 TaxID=1641866 RepID=UPI00131AACC7|nr:hypothetical protein [Granulicella sp. L60]
MRRNPDSLIERREFLKLAATATVLGLTRNVSAASSRRISIVVDAGNPVANSGPVMRAVGQLRKELISKGMTCETVASGDQVVGSALCVVVAGTDSQLAPTPSSGVVLTTAESVRFVPGNVGQVPAIFVLAIDALGFVYGLLELAERVQFNDDPMAALHFAESIENRPANEVRGVGRYFCCEIEDKVWYYDKDFWRGYLDTLVASRFNRFTFAYGLEYDFPRGVTGDYFHFAYPYLVEVPGYPDVQVLQLFSPDGTRLSKPVPLSKEERDRNFDMLRFIAAETGARGLHFQLGIWTHAFQWTDSPNAYHRIEGLTPETHAAYCRDALAILLKACPEIQGLTLRVHGESGIPEGSYPFWQTLFEAISGCGRKVEIDMHAKGVNQIMIDMAAGTGMPVKLGAKYSAEHQSLGYNQADIRALEIPHANLSGNDVSLFSVSGGARLFTRYGYGDFLHEGSKYKLLFRSWPGTQRHLLCVDPEMAAGYSRTSSFCGATGLDLMEPLTFKGREGSGASGGRCAYVDKFLNPNSDWKKYEYYYRVWGRKLYDPDTDPETWRRFLRSEFGAGAVSVEMALANASRILPLVTSTHLSSASNHDLWVEMPTSMPIVVGSEPSPYGDTPEPKCFGTVSPLDPQLFSTVIEHSQDLLLGQPNPKYSPIEVAQWIEDSVAASNRALISARVTVKSKASPAFRRIEEDVLIQTGVGSFFAAKLRSAVLYEIYLRTGSPEAGRLALDHYKTARAGWATMAGRANGVYLSDVSYGRIPKRRGHWSDRLPDIDTDIATMQVKLQSSSASVDPGQDAGEAIRAATGKPNRLSVRSAHTQPTSFYPGQALPVSIQVMSSGSASSATSVRLFYRHVNQAERWLFVAMKRENGGFTAAIPGDYTNSDYPLQYYFELRHENASAWFCPAFNSTFSNQPYYAISNRSEVGGLLGRLVLNEEPKD